ncbi:hypothetical protein MRX96_001890 [Rhipicephalus microplus]
MRSDGKPARHLSTSSVSRPPSSFSRRKYDAFSLSLEENAEVGRLESPLRREEASGNGAKGIERHNEAKGREGALEDFSQSCPCYAYTHLSRFKQQLLLSAFTSDGASTMAARRGGRISSEMGKMPLPGFFFSCGLRRCRAKAAEKTVERKEENRETNMRIPYTKDSGTSNQPHDEMKGRGGG